MPGPDQNFWNGEQGRLYQLLLPFMQDAALTGAGTALDKLTSGLGIGVDWDLVNRDAARWSREYTYSLVSRITDSSQRYLQQQVSNFVESGQPLKHLIASLTPMFGPVRADMIAATETTRAYAEGNLAVWKQSGVVDGVRWMTAEDERVCPVCKPLDGLTGDLATGVLYNGKTYKPPAHVRCRCYLQPVVRT